MSVSAPRSSNPAAKENSTTNLSEEIKELQEIAIKNAKALLDRQENLDNLRKKGEKLEKSAETFAKVCMIYLIIKR